ncbi:MAG: hypothetical protein ACOXZR_00255 [Bacilli bacterium]|jgi:hypothetical protein
MKRLTSFFNGLILLLIVITIMILDTNKTFFKNEYPLSNTSMGIPLPKYSYYEKKSTEYKATFKTIRSYKAVDTFINNYLDELISCYDESYFYDEQRRITIKKYIVEKDFPLNKITLEYLRGSFCENEFVLEDGWLTKIKKAELKEINLTKYFLVDKELQEETKELLETDLESVFANLTKRIKTKDSFNFNPQDDTYKIEVFYTLENDSYQLNIFAFNHFLIIKIIDANDHFKNALYDIGFEGNVLLKELWKR